MREGDTLAGLAERLWGDASLWWKIAEANGLTGQAALVEGQALTLPAGVQRATHNAQTFQPYDPSETIGDTAPTTLQPTPKKNKCGVLGRVFLVVIAIAVAAITRDFLTASRILSVGAKVAVAAVSGATGSIVSQGVGVATGIQDKFSWNAVALAAIGGGVGARFELQSPSGWGQVAANAAAQSIVTQGIGVATGLQEKFSWAGVAAAGVGAAVGHGVGAALPENTPRFAASLAVNAASGIANASIRTLIDGSDFGDNLLAALPDVIGQTIGGAFAEGISGAGKSKQLTAPKIELVAPIEKQSYTPITALADLPNMPSFTIADNSWRGRTPIADMKQWAEQLGGDIEFAQYHESADSARFFDPMDDNPYFWHLTEHGLLPRNASVADFFNLRYGLSDLQGPAFIRAAEAAGLTPAELLHDLNYGSSVMAERAIAAVDAIFADTGIAGTNILAHERALRASIASSGVNAAYQDRMFDEIVSLAGFTPSEYAQHQLDVGIGVQFPFLMGGGGPRITTGILPRASFNLAAPRSVWTLGPVTRGRVIEAALGHNLPSSFPIIDRFSENGLATSIKSVDLGAVAFQRATTLNRLVRGYIDQVAGFNGARYARRVIEAGQITGRSLDLVVPHMGTPAQQAIIESAVRYGESRGVAVNVLTHR